MRALWLEDRRVRMRDDVPDVVPTHGEAVVSVRLAGVCGTDLEMLNGYYPFAGVPGHEFVGEVRAAPDAPEWVGRRVVGEINAACGACAQCRAGRRTHCEARTVLGLVGRHGAFAEELSLPVANLHAVPDAVPDEAAVFTEPLAAALRVLEQVTLGIGTRVIVVGAGRLGHLVAQAIATTGCGPLVATRDGAPRPVLAERGIGAVAADTLPEGRADVVVECTGHPDGLAVARRAVRPGGTIVLKSTYAGEAAVALSRVVVDEVTLVGSRCGPVAPALTLLARRAVSVLPMIDRVFALDDAPAALARAAQPGVLKVLLRP